MPTNDSAGLADANAEAWHEFDPSRPMPTWFQAAAETLTLLHERIKFQDTYLVFDTETCGFDPKTDYILEVGWAVVVDRQIVDNQGLILDWTRHPSVRLDDLTWRIEKTRASMAEHGRPYAFSIDRLRSEGVDPIEGLYIFTKLLYDAAIAGEWLVGHNAWRFDRNMVNGHTMRFMQGYRLPWDDITIFDTGLTEKAIQMNRPPWPEEDLEDWFCRLDKARQAGVGWNLDVHCWNKYAIGERFGFDQTNAHEAGFDCKVTHCLLETFRQLLSALCGPGRKGSV